MSKLPPKRSKKLPIKLIFKTPVRKPFQGLASLAKKKSG
jgi:hypothetical protein